MNYRKSIGCCVVVFGVLIVSGGAMSATNAAPLAQEYAVAFHNLDREYYVEGCGLARLDDGALVAVVPRVQWSKERRAEHSRTHIVRSADGGGKWSEPVTLFRGHFWNCHTGMVLRERTRCIGLAEGESNICHKPLVWGVDNTETNRAGDSGSNYVLQRWRGIR